jgi:hypothetical protein
LPEAGASGLFVARNVEWHTPNQSACGGNGFSNGRKTARTTSDRTVALMARLGKSTPHVVPTATVNQIDPAEGNPLTST